MSLKKFKDLNNYKKNKKSHRYLKIFPDSLRQSLDKKQKKFFSFWMRFKNFNNYLDL